MKAGNILILITIFSFNVNAAFTEPEMTQLEDINTKYITKTEEAQKNLDLEIKEAIKNIPQEKRSILNLDKLWSETIKGKCRLMTLESSGTDAEIAKTNECLSEEYNKEADFFKNIY